MQIRQEGPAPGGDAPCACEGAGGSAACPHPGTVPAHSRPVRGVPRMSAFWPWLAESLGTASCALPLCGNARKEQTSQIQVQCPVKQRSDSVSCKPRSTWRNDPRSRRLSAPGHRLPLGPQSRSAVPRSRRGGRCGKSGGGPLTVQFTAALPAPSRESCRATCEAMSRVRPRVRRAESR